MFAPGGGVQSQSNTTNIKHGANKACTDEFRFVDADFCSASPEIQAKRETICAA
jgi:hypothetical protein